jgi:hypothetical protein
MLEEAMLMPAGYAVYSAALHADWHSIVGNWMQTTAPDGSGAVVISPAPSCSVGRGAGRCCTGHQVPVPVELF